MPACSGTQLEFHGLGKRAVVARFDGGHISSDRGALLLREVEKRTRIMARMAEQFTDYRDPELIEHSVEALVSQRVLGFVLGYADLNDHDCLRFDALLALAAGKRDSSGQDRRHERDKGKAPASSSTLNRLELTLAANQLRLYMSTFAYVLLRSLRRLGLQGTDLADAQCGTIRTRLLKFGAPIRISVSRIRIALSESFPAQQIFEQALRNLHQVALRAAPA